MTTIGKLLLGVALGASLPAMAVAQRATNDPDRNGNQLRQERGDGQRGFAGGRGPQAQAAGQAQREQAQQVGRPDQAPRPDRPQEFNRDRGQGGNFAGNQARGDDRRGNGNRFDTNRNDGRRYDNDRGRFDNDRGRFDNNRGGDNRWVGSNWRQDQRYNWQSYRNSNRNQFRGGRYNAPRGWSYGYRRFSVGAVLPGLLWGSGFWLNDPYQYRLPPAYGPYRWVRYYDDVMLVDIRTGRVVDAIPGFFW